jgi:hypothetical protein
MARIQARARSDEHQRVDARHSIFVTAKQEGREEREARDSSLPDLCGLPVQMLGIIAAGVHF